MGGKELRKLLAETSAVPGLANHAAAAAGSAQRIQQFISTQPNC